jgi:hypothetical protein
MKYRKKPVVIEAIQWLGHNHFTFIPEVKEYDPYAENNGRCSICHKNMTEHGWIGTLEGGHIVCPNDWIITGVQGEKYPCKPDIFEATYEKV